MFFDLDSILPEFFIEVGLQALKPKGVTILVLPVVVTILLKAIVCQMNVVILVGEGVVVTGCPHVALLIHEQLILPGEQSPYTQVKLSLTEEHGLLYVFLDDPEGVHRPRKDELLDVLDIAEDLDAFALVHSGRFD